MTVPSVKKEDLEQSRKLELREWFKQAVKPKEERTY